MYKEDEYFFAAKSISILTINDTLKNLRQKALRDTEPEPHVLILGEAGVGKDILARLICQGSRREKKPWLVLHCALTEDELILEKEIFGEEKFAFNQKCILNGLFDLAKGGTVFFEKIERLPLSLQERLFQTIKSGSYRRVGGTEDLIFDVRLIAETAQNLKPNTPLLSPQGNLSESLYQVLSTLTFKIPPLRERPEDILPIAHSFAESQYRNEGKQFQGFTPETLNSLTFYNWPGNTHELLCLIKRSALLSKNSSLVTLNLSGDLTRNLLGTHFSPSIAVQPLEPSEVPDFTEEDQTFIQLKRHWCDSFEKAYIVKTLHHHKGNVSAAAREAKLDRSNFLRMMRRHQVKADNFRTSQQEADPITFPKAA